MKLAVFGAGGVGAYLGARLADAGHEVHLIARGEHLEALRADGLRLESVAGDTTVRLPATDDPAEVGSCDAVLFCVKAYDTRSAAAELAPLLEAGTAVVSFQNGVDNERWLADEVGEEHVCGGVAYVFSTIGARASSSTPAVRHGSSTANSTGNRPTASAGWTGRSRRPRASRPSSPTTSASSCGGSSSSSARRPA